MRGPHAGRDNGADVRERDPRHASGGEARLLSTTSPIPDEGQYLWSYTVTIENNGAEPVQLMSRYWHITDALGREKEVRGPGVVGAQPVIAPGQTFEYTSGCPLPTSSGHMVGHYQMKTASGEAFRGRNPAPSCLKARTSAARSIRARSGAG